MVLILTFSDFVLRKIRIAEANVSNNEIKIGQTTGLTQITGIKKRTSKSPSELGQPVNNLKNI